MRMRRYDLAAVKSINSYYVMAGRSLHARHRQRTLQRWPSGNDAQPAMKPSRTPSCPLRARPAIIQNELYACWGEEGGERMCSSAAARGQSLG
jgi:hypothetical protein